MDTGNHLTAAASLRHGSSTQGVAYARGSIALIREGTWTCDSVLGVQYSMHGYHRNIGLRFCGFQCTCWLRCHWQVADLLVNGEWASSRRKRTFSAKPDRERSTSNSTDLSAARHHYQIVAGLADINPVAPLVVWAPPAVV